WTRAANVPATPVALGRRRVVALSCATVSPPRWIARVLRWLTIVLVAVFAAATLFVAAVVPYRFWDSLAFGSWSRAIADTGSLWASTGALNVSRPLFYVP